MRVRPRFLPHAPCQRSSGRGARLLAALCLAALLSLVPATGRAAPGQGLAGNGPIAVTADNMTYDTAGNTVVFTGKVEVRRDEFRLWADKITLYLKADGKTSGGATGKAEGAETSAPASAPASGGTPAMDPGNLDRIVAEKNVRFHYQTQTGQAARATYSARDASLLLEGNPIIRDGENSVTGHTIRYYLNENRSEVEGGPKKRVEAVFQSGTSSGTSGGRQAGGR